MAINLIVSNGTIEVVIAGGAVTTGGGGGGGNTNLSYTASPTQGQVNSDTGTDAIIPLADGTNAGLLTPAEKTKLSNTSGTNSGNETTSTLGATINGATSATPNDTDLVATVDTSVVKKITWANVKAFLKTYFDAIYTLANLGGVATSRTISTTSPLAGGGDLSANRILTINQATTSTNGYLSSTDWNTFNDKQARLGFTPENSANKKNTTLDTSSTKYPTNNLVKTNLDLKTAKAITANRQTASYTLVLGDVDKLVEMNVAGANNLTVPPNASVVFPIGSQILLAQYGAGQTTVVAGSGVTIRSEGGKLKLFAQYSGATLIKISSDEWYLWGSLTT